MSCELLEHLITATEKEIGRSPSARQPGSTVRGSSTHKAPQQNQNRGRCMVCMAVECRLLAHKTDGCKVGILHRCANAYQAVPAVPRTSWAPAGKSLHLSEFQFTPPIRRGQYPSPPAPQAHGEAHAFKGGTLACTQGSVSERRLSALTVKMVGVTNAQQTFQKMLGWNPIIISMSSQNLCKPAKRQQRPCVRCGGQGEADARAPHSRTLAKEEPK